MKYISFILRIATAVILFQTLYFKFTGAAESVWIFTQLGVEPVGRYGSGIVELIAAILLLIQPLSGLAALLTAGTMAGALMSHLFIFGIEVQNDGGLLFGLALFSFVAAAVIAWSERVTLRALAGKVLPFLF